MINVVYVEPDSHHSPSLFGVHTASLDLNVHAAYAAKRWGYPID